MRTTLRIPTAIALPVAVLALAVAAATLTARAHADPEHGEHSHRAPRGMTVQIATRPAPGGVLLRVRTRKFRWAPEHLSPVHGQGRVISGEGHAHVYVDGSTKPTIVVARWMYLPLDPGRHTLRVTLNGNDHNEYRRNGHAIEDSTRVTVPEAREMED